MSVPEIGKQCGPFQANPFKFAGRWYWHDETGEATGPYTSQSAALRGLLKYMDWLETGGPWWFKLLVAWKEFWHDTRG